MLVSLFRKLTTPLMFLLFLTSTGNAQESRMSLSTRPDENVQGIFNILTTELLKITPWADASTQVTLSSDSALNRGEINSQFVLNSTPALSTQGHIETLLTVRGQETQIQNNLTITTTPQFFYDLVEKSVGSSVSSLADFKTQTLLLVKTLSSSQTRQTMNFDGSSSTNTVDPNQVQLFIDALENGIQISSMNGQEVMVIDMTNIKSSWEPLADSLSQLQWLVAMTRMEVHSRPQTMEISIQTSSSLSSSIIENYDSYLSSQQNTVGLTSLHELIQAIGSWTIELCSSSEYVQECINKILYECSTSVASISGCVKQAENVRGLVAAKNDGDILGIIRYGTAAAAHAGADSINSGAQEVINWAIGEE